MTRNRGFLLSQSDRFLVSLGFLDAPDVQLFFKYKASLYFENFFNDRNDCDVAFLTD